MFCQVSDNLRCHWPSLKAQSTDTLYQNCFLAIRESFDNRGVDFFSGGALPLVVTRKCMTTDIMLYSSCCIVDSIR